MKTNQDKKMARFYRMVAIYARKNGRVTLKELEGYFRKEADSIFSWMQWSDAKQFFLASNRADGIEYQLAKHLQYLTQGEINDTINKYYGVYQD